MAIIRTVLGDVKPDELGAILPHEHTVFSFLGAETDPGSSYDREEVIQRCAEELKVESNYAHMGLREPCPHGKGSGRSRGGSKMV